MIKNTIFFGNGLNYLESANISWKELLKKIKSKHFNDNHLPNTLTYERIILDIYTKGDVLDTEYLVKKRIAELLENVRLHQNVFN
jgi:hypothetical protein